MIEMCKPFCVPVLLPGTGRVVQAFLTCVFPDGEVLVEIDGVKYHCIVNEAKMLQLSDHAEEKRVRLTAIEAISVLGQAVASGEKVASDA